MEFVSVKLGNPCFSSGIWILWGVRAFINWDKILGIFCTMISSGVNLVMTVIGFAVSTMFIVFVCTRLICARIHLNASRRSFLIASRSNLSLVNKHLFICKQV